MVVNKRILHYRIILQHLTYYFRNRLYLHSLVYSSCRTHIHNTQKQTFGMQWKQRDSTEIQSDNVMGCSRYLQIVTLLTR